MSAAVFAPAKVNLCLHVGPPRPDGYHPIFSLMAFADVGDRLTAEACDRFELVLEGPTADHAPAGEDNLVLRAARALLDRFGAPEPRLRLTLHKALPAEAGLGGGSSDAAAALRLLRDALGIEATDADLQRIAANVGSDVPACVGARPVIAEGRGERLSEAPILPDLPAVLVRPPVACSTAAVYKAFDAAGPAPLERPVLPEGFSTPAAAADWLAERRNDLQTAAVALQPRIGEALEQLAASREALLARMSGSGSACFALCADAAAAARLAARLGADNPDWWVAACLIGGRRGAAPLPGAAG